MTEPVKICIVTSTRADWGLLSPLAHAIKAHPLMRLQIIATNMHLLPRYGHTLDEITAEGFVVDATVPLPDADDSPAAKVINMAECMAGIAPVLQSLSPHLLVVLGDRYEMLAVASASAVMTIPIVHIAGGEISEGAIDDSIRHAITKLSSLHFTATEAYRQRVIQMGEHPSRVINTGALGVWNITHQPLLSCSDLSASLGFEIVPGRTLLVTYHPVTLQADDSACDAMLEALDRFPDYRVVITYPNNDAGSHYIISRIAAFAAERPGRVLLVKSLGMLRYLSLLQYAAAVIGNSSSGIVEVPSMGIPTVDIGMRQQGRISAPSVIHCGTSAQDIYEAISRALSPEMQALAAQRQNPYAQPDTIEIMVRALLDASHKAISPKHFYDIDMSSAPSPQCPVLSGSAAESPLTSAPYPLPSALRPLFIIPARGGSKGIPKKNIKLLGGKPLIAYSIEVAKALAPDSHIILSTDSPEIAQVARDCHLPVPYMRPDALATDTAGSREVILDAMDWADAHGIQYDCVVLLQPTSPLRTVSDVTGCMALYSSDIDMVVSVTDAESNPYYNCFEIDPDTGFLHVSKGDGLYTRRQDAPPAYEYNGAVYVINPASIRRAPLGAFARRVPMPMPRSRSIDLDTPTDWTVAEALISKQ